MVLSLYDLYQGYSIHITQEVTKFLRFLSVSDNVINQITYCSYK